MDSVYIKNLNNTLKWTNYGEKIKNINLIISQLSLTIPFKNNQLKNKKELIKWIILCYPYNYKSIGNIIYMLIYKNQNDTKFWRNIIISWEEIFCIFEKNNNNNYNKRKKDYYKIKNDYNEFPKEIIKNLINIKLVSLKILKKINKIIIFQYQHILNRKNKILSGYNLSFNLYTFFKNLITFTASVEVLIKSEKLICFLKDYELLFFEFSEYDQIKELLVQKKEEYLIYYSEYSYKANKNNFDLPNNLKKNKKTLNKKIKKLGIFTFLKSKARQLKIHLVKKKNKNNYREDFKEILENFWINKQIRIKFNNIILKEFSFNKNFEIVFGFIFNPFSYEISEYFIDNCKEENLDKFKFFFKNLNQFTVKKKNLKSIYNLNSSNKELENIKIKFSKFYQYRSFLSTMVLLEKENHNLIYSSNKNFFLIFFENIYKGIKENINDINLNLLYWLLDFYLINNVNEVICYIVKFNFIFFLFQNLNNNKISNLLINILVPNKIYNINFKTRFLIWKYLELTLFFPDIIKEILFSNEKFEFSKFSKNYNNAELIKIYDELVNLSKNNNSIKNKFNKIYESFFKKKIDSIHLNEHLYGIDYNIDNIILPRSNKNHIKLSIDEEISYYSESSSINEEKNDEKNKINKYAIGFEEKINYFLRVHSEKEKKKKTKTHKNNNSSVQTNYVSLNKVKNLNINVNFKSITKGNILTTRDNILSKRSNKFKIKYTKIKKSNLNGIYKISKENNIYPKVSSVNLLKFNNIKIKKKLLNLNHETFIIKEKFALKYSEFLYFLIKDLSYIYDNKDNKLNILKCEDISYFINFLLEISNFKIFKGLFKNILMKYKYMFLCRYSLDITSVERNLESLIILCKYIHFDINSKNNNKLYKILIIFIKNYIDMYEQILCKILQKYKANNPIKLQNYNVNRPIGNKILLFFELYFLLIYIINDKDIIEKSNPKLLQLIIFNLFEKRNNMFLYLKFLDFLKFLIINKYENVLIIIFINLNLIGNLYEELNHIIFNNSIIDYYKNEKLLLFSCQILKLLNFVVLIKDYNNVSFSKNRLLNLNSCKLNTDPGDFSKLSNYLLNTYSFKKFKKILEKLYRTEYDFLDPEDLKKLLNKI